MINQSGDFVDHCLFLGLFVFVSQAYKRLGELGSFPSLPSLLLHHLFTNQITMSPTHSSFLFSFKEDASAPDMVESMEQVGDLASLCLK